MSDAGGQRLGGVIDAGDLGAVYSRGDQERRQAAIHPHPAATVVAAGWVLGVLTTVPPVGVGFLFAFLAGGIVLNTLKEELPQERESRLWPFLTGAGVYAALMLAEEFIA